MIILIKDEDEYFVDLEYRDIKKGLYEISNYGEIRNKVKGNLLKPFYTRDGYLRIALQNNVNKSKKYSIHRLVANAFISKDNPELEVNHKNSIRDENFYKNLEWCTPKENIKHAIVHGGRPTGTPRYISNSNKYSLQTIEFICELLSENLSTKEILDNHFVFSSKLERRSYKTLIVDIRSGKSWKSISSKYNI